MLELPDPSKIIPRKPGTARAAMRHSAQFTPSLPLSPALPRRPRKIVVSRKLRTRHTTGTARRSYDFKSSRLDRGRWSSRVTVDKRDGASGAAQSAMARPHYRAMHGKVGTKGGPEGRG